MEQVLFIGLDLWPFALLGHDAGQGGFAELCQLPRNLNLVLSAGSPASDKMVSRLAAGRACCVQGSPQL